MMRASCSVKQGRSGRGPTRLMSPRRTLSSCGSSSMRWARMKAPTRVMRGSRSVAQRGPAASASTRMLRNFSNVKTLPRRPTRSWRYITGPRDSSLIRQATRRQRGRVRNSSSRLPVMSRRRRTVPVHAASCSARPGARAGGTRSVVVALMGGSLDGDGDGIGHLVRLCWADFYRRRGRYGYELTHTLGQIMGGPIPGVSCVVRRPWFATLGVEVRKPRDSGSGVEDHRRMDMDDDACYRAIVTRDRRFDGRLFVAVRTTGIYCRPFCPAPTPKRENVRFFPTAAAAQEAGFRPCLRCRPETSPELALWRGSSNTVSRALRLIEAGALDEANVEALAERLGVGERQLRRLFQQHLGASPISIAQTRRILLAKQLIQDTAAADDRGRGGGGLRQRPAVQRDLPADCIGGRRRRCGGRAWSTAGRRRARSR